METIFSIYMRLSKNAISILVQVLPKLLFSLGFMEPSALKQHI